MRESVFATLGLWIKLLFWLSKNVELSGSLTQWVHSWDSSAKVLLDTRTQ